MIRGLREKLLTDAEIASIVGTRIYPLLASQPANKTYITLQEISVDPERCLSGISGVAQTGIQLDIWSTLYSEIETLRTAIRRVVDGLTNENLGEVNVRSIRVDSQFDDYEKPSDGSDNTIFRKSMDIYIWHEDTLN
jgi:hypothetical protein